MSQAGPWLKAEVEAALEIVRGFDPPGICAFDLPDCLLRQVRLLELDNPLLEEILTKHWKPFLNRQFAALSRDLNVPMPELQAVLEVVKNLETKPGRRYSAERTVYVQPDVIVRKVDGDYVVLLEEDGLPRLRISGAYRRMLQGQNGGLNGEAKEYLRERMRSAVWLIKTLDQRHRHISKGAKSIASPQKEFFQRGIERLPPLGVSA